MIEFRVPASHLSAELDYYRELQQLLTGDKAAAAAADFSRRWEDLARRVLAVQAAQAGINVEYPPAMTLAALKAYISCGPVFSASQFLSVVPADWPTDQARLLAGLADWYSAHFDPNDPIANSLQVWAGPLGDRLIRLYGPGITVGPGQPFLTMDTPPVGTWLSAARSGRPVALVAHYDVHGLSMLALTLRNLRQLGVDDIDCTLSFELTGDISKLWKRTIPRALTSEREYAAVIMIDCSVHSRKPEHTLKAVARLDQATACELVIIDHHQDTAGLAPQLLRDRLSLVLTDVPLCGLITTKGETEQALMALGSIGDKVPDVSAAFSPERTPDLHQACTEYHHRLINFSPTPHEMKLEGVMPAAALWNALAAGERITAELATQTLGVLAAPELPPLPEAMTCGSLLFVTQRLTSVGRTWYALLERLMNQADVHYAVALRILDDRRANMLLLTDWQAVRIPPIRYFVPEEFGPRCLGHLTAVWIDVEKHQALELLNAVAEGVNDFMEHPADFTPVADELEHNILNPPPPAILH